MIGDCYKTALEALARSGWKVEFLDQRRPLPANIIARYPWMPAGYREAMEWLNTACSPDDKVWLLTANDFIGAPDAAFAWNEWERQSLEAASGDHAWQSAIEAFWDRHLPVLMSVKSQYSYWAIEHTNLRVIAGEEPEYEETAFLASSILEALNLLAAQNLRVGRWL